MNGDERTPPGRFARGFWAALVALAICRLGGAWYAGLEHNRGDFYATLPGAYAETLNPVLWNSPDLKSADGFQRAEYLYGPTQYLTIFPLVFFDSYDAIARFLLFLYPVLLGFATYLMWKAFRPRRAPPLETAAALVVSTSLFLPVLQAYAQREFEIVILLAITAAVHAMVTSRQGLGGVLIAYATWFKFFPLAFLGYFVVRGWRRAAVAFVVASVCLLALTEVLLGLARFRAVVELAGVEATASLAPAGFCEAWAQPETRHHAVATATRAGVKWAACSFADRWSWLDAQFLHVGTLALVMLAFAAGHRRLRQTTLDEDHERWRRSLEAGLVLTLPWLFSHAHYYYLAFAIVPLNALLVRYIANTRSGGSARMIGIWLCAYALLGAFVVPPSVLTSVVGVDFWQWYMRNNISFFGELLLIGLVLWEYLTIPIAREPATAASPLHGHLVEAR
jgi:hypothetical protein